jgi:hypothetical protein
VYNAMLYCIIEVISSRRGFWECEGADAGRGRHSAVRVVPAELQFMSEDGSLGASSLLAGATAWPIAVQQSILPQHQLHHNIVPTNAGCTYGRNVCLIRSSTGSGVEPLGGSIAPPTARPALRWLWYTVQGSGLRCREAAFQFAVLGGAVWSMRLLESD